LPRDGRSELPAEPKRAPPVRFPLQFHDVPIPVLLAAGKALLRRLGVTRL
jgi:hypothetical protein